MVSMVIDKELQMNQYIVMYAGCSIDYTPYFKSVRAVRTWLKKRYKDCNGMTFASVKDPKTIYSVL